MIDGETAARIYMEVVIKHLHVSANDTPDERNYRNEINTAVQNIVESDGGLEMPKEWQ